MEEARAEFLYNLAKEWFRRGGGEILPEWRNLPVSERTYWMQTERHFYYTFPLGGA